MPESLPDYGYNSHAKQVGVSNNKRSAKPLFPGSKSGRSLYLAVASKAATVVVETRTHLRIRDFRTRPSSFGDPCVTRRLRLNA